MRYDNQLVISFCCPRKVSPGGVWTAVFTWGNSFYISMAMWNVFTCSSDNRLMLKRCFKWMFLLFLCLLPRLTRWLLLVYNNTYCHARGSMLKTNCTFSTKSFYLNQVSSHFCTLNLNCDSYNMGLWISKNISSNGRWDILRVPPLLIFGLLCFSLSSTQNPDPDNHQASCHSSSPWNVWKSPAVFTSKDPGRALKNGMTVKHTVVRLIRRRCHPHRCTYSCKKTHCETVKALIGFALFRPEAALWDNWWGSAATNYSFILCQGS